MLVKERNYTAYFEKAQLASRKSVTPDIIIDRVTPKTLLMRQLLTPTIF